MHKDLPCNKNHIALDDLSKAKHKDCIDKAEYVSILHKDDAFNTRDQMLGLNDYEICFFLNTLVENERASYDPMNAMKRKHTVIRRNKLLHDQTWVFN